CQRLQVGRLLLPVHPPADQVVAVERHLGTAAEDLPNVLLIVLAAQTEQHAGVVLADEEFLESTTWWIDLDTVRPDFAAHALPKRFVTSNDDYFPRRRLEGVNPAGQQRAQRRKERRHIRNMTQLIAIRVVCSLDWIGRRQLSRRDQVEALPAKEPSHEAL